MKRSVMKYITFFVVCSVFVRSSSAFSDETVTLTAVVFEDGSHSYYYELLEEALKHVGYELELKEIAEIPQKRIIAMLDQEDDMSKPMNASCVKF
jgi:hypothetical protein